MHHVEEMSSLIQDKKALSSACDWNIGYWSIPAVKIQVLNTRGADQWIHDVQEALLLVGKGTYGGQPHESWADSNHQSPSRPSSCRQVHLQSNISTVQA